ncbi:MAG: metal dependent phosphohydrolase [Bryobacterales bacterium]|jgi:3'-5' exoribonuclease|nr:metal dependent phosphohydrolase [Bryobacterales bacterium]
MKSPYVDGLVPNELVTAHFLVLSKEIRQKKTGEPYLSLYLADRTGEVEAKMWDSVAEVMDTFERDDFVKVKGVAQLYQSRTQFTIHRLKRIEDNEVDFADYFPCSQRDIEQMFSELQEIIAGVGNPHLRGLLTALFADPALVERYKIAPAAKSIHHAYRGGLLEHVLSLLKLAKIVAPHYKEVDLDLMVAGVVLHDIGKVEELRYERSFSYSSEGQLLGHIIIGLRILGDKLASMPDFPPRLRTLLEHMLISHHGELEFGSPKVPQFAEALLLHHLDNLDSKMEAMKNALRRDTQDGEFTGWVNSLERSLLRKERYLANAPSAPVTVAEASASTVSKPPPPPTPSVAPQPAPARPERPERRPAAPTLFGEKLQAVLDTRK